MDESWKTPEMVEAERLLAEQADLVDQAIAKARAVSARIEITPLTDKEIADIDHAARAPEAPEELRRLSEKVGYGQLMWQEVFSEKGMRHREVRDALAELRLSSDELALLEAVSQAYRYGARPESDATPSGYRPTTRSSTTPSGSEELVCGVANSRCKSGAARSEA